MDTEYEGFEQGPIRPPSESGSLLIRITRNCPWNRCTFCPVYKGEKFSLRDVEHVIQDIDTIKKSVDDILKLKGDNGIIKNNDLIELKNSSSTDYTAFYTALNWINNGMESVFLQDANSLIIKPENLIRILRHLKRQFPFIKRITSYARSHTINRISDENLREFAVSGLNRIHIGLESGSDKVLELVKKGVTKEEHINAGLKVKNAGMELSEYIMPGLGGKKFTRENALETADVLNKIDPDFIRLRSLAIPEHIELYRDLEKGNFEKLNDTEVAEEILLLLENLEGLTGYIKSDHILNLFEDVEGQFPYDKEKMVTIVKTYLGFSEKDKMIYQVGRRTGMFRKISDMENEVKVQHIKDLCKSNGIDEKNVDKAIDELMKRFI